MKAWMVLRKKKFEKPRSSRRAIINHLPTFFFIPQVEKVKQGEVSWRLSSIPYQGDEFFKS
jgi:hypothetical protein